MPICRAILRKAGKRDMKVILQDNMIQTDLYSKPTDSHSYLLYDSAHPQRCKGSIPYSQFLRVRRICSLDSDFKEHVLELTYHFMVRGYPMKLLQKLSTWHWFTFYDIKCSYAWTRMAIVLFFNDFWCKDEKL